MGQSQRKHVAYAPPRIVYMVGEDGSFTYVNNLMCFALIRRRDELLGMNADHMLRPCEDTHASEAHNWVIAAWCRAHPGQRRHVRSHAYASDGHKVEFVGTVYWQPGADAWVIEAKITPQEYGRILRLHPGAQFLDVYDQAGIGQLLVEQEARARRAEIHEVVQQALLELHAPEPPKQLRPRRTRPHGLSPEVFKARLRTALGELSDPEQLSKVTVEAVYGKLNMARNTLAEYLRHYGYVQDGEMISRTLQRLARAWWPHHFE